MAMPRFEVYEDAAGTWRWRLKDANGVKIASSGESFASEFNAKRAAENVKATAPSAVVVGSSSGSPARSALLAALLDQRRSY